MRERATHTDGAVVAEILKLWGGEPRLHMPPDLAPDQYLKLLRKARRVFLRKLRRRFPGIGITQITRCRDIAADFLEMADPLTDEMVGGVLENTMRACGVRNLDEFLDSPQYADEFNAIDAELSRLRARRH
jgi:hypothetical protein